MYKVIPGKASIHLAPHMGITTLLTPVPVLYFPAPRLSLTAPCSPSPSPTSDLATLHLSSVSPSLLLVPLVTYFVLQIPRVSEIMWCFT